MRKWYIVNMKTKRVVDMYYEWEWPSFVLEKYTTEGNDLLQIIDKRAVLQILNP